MKMKSRNMTFMLYLTAVFSMLFMLSNSAMAGIKGSVHDFATKTWNTNKEICVVCHTPHNSDISVKSAPLWNHAVTATQFTAYSSPTLDAQFADADSQPTGASKLCLSCHDGSLGIDEYGINIGKPSPEIMSKQSAIVGLNGDLTNDHPISINYNQTTIDNDKALHALSNPVTIGAGAKTRTGTVSTLLVPDGNVQCSSCHDVHNTFITDSGKLLKVSLANSQLCLSCHDK